MKSGISGAKMTKQVDADPFEEFEFKPLTEGLGFHRKEEANPKAAPTANVKAAAAGASAKAERAFDIPSLDKNNKEKNRIETPRDRRKLEKTSEQTMADDLLDLGSLEPKDLDKPLLKTPLLKKHQIQIEEKAPASEKVDEVLKSFQSRKWDFKDSNQIKRSSLQTPPEVVYRPSGYDFSALILDSMLIVASFLGCLILLLMITQVDLVATVTTASTLMLGLSTAAILFSVCFIYLTINRLFLGATPGEWVFDQRLGAPEVQGRASFSLKVVGRTLIILATGLVIFPLVSLIRGRDVLGRWMGLELHQKTLH